MAKKTQQVKGRTINQYARHVGVDPATVREWIEQGRLDVVEYRNEDKFGRGGKEALLVLITDEDRPPRLIPHRGGK